MFSEINGLMREGAEFSLNAVKRVRAAYRRTLRLKAEHWGWLTLPVALGGTKGARKLEEVFDLGRWEQQFKPLVSNTGESNLEASPPGYGSDA